MNGAITAGGVFESAKRNRRHLTILLLGFASGLPAALTAGTLQAWFTEAGISLKTIGAVTLLVLPYSLRFLWAPLLDHFELPGIDRRRGWLFVTQIGLIIAISTMAFSNPHENFMLFSWQIPTLMVIGLLTAFFSTSQDIVINAYQTEVLPVEERGLGAAIYITGWRIGAVISGAASLLLASQLGWQTTYLLMASLMAVGIIGTAIAPPSPHVRLPAASLTEVLIMPFVEFFQRVGFKYALIIMSLIITYKLSDALALALNTTFLLRGMGYSLALIGTVNKTVSIVASVAGGLLAGAAMTRLTLYQALLFFGWIQGLANLCYALMAYLGKSFFMLVFTAFTENFCSGMGTIALYALIMALCQLRYTATQFALFVAIAFVGRTFAGPLAATMVESMGWLTFFIWCFLLSLPTLVFVYLGKNYILQLKK